MVVLGVLLSPVRFVLQIMLMCIAAVVVPVVVVGGMILLVVGIVFFASWASSLPSAQSTIAWVAFGVASVVCVVWALYGLVADE